MDGRGPARTIRRVAYRQDTAGAATTCGLMPANARIVGNRREDSAPDAGTARRRGWATAHRLTLALTLLISLALAHPLATASAPDPLWIAGIYDGGDGDDVVGLLTGTAAAVRCLLVALDPLLSFVQSIPAADLSVYAVPSFLAVRLRSPPTR